jgi:23S rRNA C2498 (ribose-2'-O)-methylase RlmM
VLQPIEAYLRRITDFRFQMRQLYHDRREVTVFGVCVGNK